MAQDAILYYINWTGKINNNQTGSVDLAGGIAGKEHAEQILKEMRTRYQRGKVVLRTQPIWQYMEGKPCG